jgi:hypothetical protein
LPAVPADVRLPDRYVPADDAEAVLRLEADTLPYAAAAERVSAALAERLDATADAVDAALRAT